MGNKMPVAYLQRLRRVHAVAVTTFTAGSDGSAAALAAAPTTFTAGSDGSAAALAAAPRAA